MTDPNSTELPVSMQIAWGLRARPGKGPRPGLTLERIVAGAITVADTEGLAAVSMNRVARELGVATMSLYRYISAKSELLDLMMDAAVGPPPAPEEPAESWRAALTRWCWNSLAGFRQHPWMLQVPISSPPIAPNHVAWMEQALSALRGTGLGAGERLSAIMLLNGYIRNWAMLNADLEAAATATGITPDDTSARYWRQLAGLVHTGPFPALRELLAEEDMTAPDEDPDFVFTFGIERILDGIEVLIRSRQQPAG